MRLVSSADNESSDRGDPPPDESSPNFPEGAAHPRTIDNSRCATMPAEAQGVVVVSSVREVTGQTTCASNALPGTTTRVTPLVRDCHAGVCACTNGSRGPRWRPPTRPASRRSSSPSAAGATAHTVA